MFFSFVNKNLPSRDLLILDEAHLLETELVRFRGISISRKRWKKYIPDLKIENHGYDVRGWVDFLVRLKQTMSVFVNMLNEELLVEATQDIDKLELAIDSIVSNATNWIVSEVKKHWHGLCIHRQLSFKRYVVQWYLHSFIHSEATPIPCVC
jgi:Rad3-related DNA helicase